MKVFSKDFRTADEAYFDYATCVGETKKQNSPFIVHTKGQIHAIYYLRDLINCNSDADIFHAWPGQWRTDIFYYKPKSLLNFLKSHPSAFE